MSETIDAILYRHVMLSNLNTEQWSFTDQHVYFVFVGSQVLDELIKQQPSVDKQKEVLKSLFTNTLNQVYLLNQGNSQQPVHVYSQILMDNISALKVYPTQMYNPVNDQYSNELTMYIRVPNNVNGVIGFNTQHEPMRLFFNQLNYMLFKGSTTNNYVYRYFAGWQYLYSKDTLFIPYILVLFYNPVKFAHMSAQIIQNQVLKYGETQLSQEPLPQQTTYEFAAENIVYRDFIQSQQLEYNALYSQLNSSKQK